MTRVPRPPEGCTEHPPMGPGELVRWRCPTAAGDVTFALLDGRVQWWSGPGVAQCETRDPSHLYALADAAEALGNWLVDHEWVPDGQVSLFDEAAHG